MLESLATALPFCLALTHPNTPVAMQELWCERISGDGGVFILPKEVRGNQLDQKAFDQRMESGMAALGCCGAPRFLEQSSRQGNIGLNDWCTQP